MQRLGVGEDLDAAVRRVADDLAAAERNEDWLAHAGEYDAEVRAPAPEVSRHPSGGRCAGSQRCRSNRPMEEMP
jgi:hypothetical protein